MPPINTLSVEGARQRCLETFRTKGDPESVDQVVNRTISVTIGNGKKLIPIRLYTQNSDTPLPILVYFHGGGFVVNSLETHDGICRSIANSAGCIVVSVDYSLAPEQKYPAALDDCFAATQWVADHAASINGNRLHIAVGGDSSGGTLAAGVALRARDTGTVGIMFQLLIYPALDYHLPGTPSYQRFAVGYSLTRDIMAWFYNHYLPEDIDFDDPYLFPLRSGVLENLPPALVITAECDPLRDEGEAYAKRLKKAGVPVRSIRYGGMIHGFIIMSHWIDKGKTALHDASSILKKAFEDHSEATNYGDRTSLKPRSWPR